MRFFLLYLFGVFLTGGLPNLLSVNQRGNARRASCQSNMKQLGLALAMYSQDYGSLPSAATASGKSGWREAVYPYIKSSGVYHCPDDSRSYDYKPPVNLPESYAANALCFGSHLKPAALTKLSPTAILAADVRGYGGEDWDISSPAFLPSSGRELYTHKLRHLFYVRTSGRLNCLLADGHVKAMPPMATLTPINLWTPDDAPFVGADLANAQAILKNAETK